jgi:hypothetical protein
MLGKHRERCLKRRPRRGTGVCLARASQVRAEISCTTRSFLIQTTPCEIRISLETQLMCCSSTRFAENLHAIHEHQEGRAATHLEFTSG